MSTRLFLSYIQQKQNNNFEMTSFTNERRSKSFLKLKSLYESEGITWNTDSAGALSRGLHLRPFSTLSDQERHKLGQDSRFLGTHTGFQATDEHFDDIHFVRGMQGKPFLRSKI